MLYHFSLRRCFIIFHPRTGPLLRVLLHRGVGSPRPERTTSGPAMMDDGSFDLRACRKLTKSSGELKPTSWGCSTISRLYGVSKEFPGPHLVHLDGFCVVKVCV